MKDHVLGIAARYNDAEAEEHGFADFVQSQGLTVADVMYLAEQRAIRVLYVATGRDMSIFGGREPRAIELSGDDRLKVIAFQSAELDGMLIGWRGRGLHDGT